MESYHKRKRILEEKYGKLISLKPLNDERVVIASNRQQKLLKQASQSNGFHIKDVIFPSNFVSMDTKKADVALKIALIQRLMLTVSSELRELAESLSEEKIGV